MENETLHVDYGISSLNAVVVVVNSVADPAMASIFGGEAQLRAKE